MSVWTILLLVAFVVMIASHLRGHGGHGGGQTQGGHRGCGGGHGHNSHGSEPAEPSSAEVGERVPTDSHAAHK